MATSTRDEPADDVPLDAAAERTRRRLLRFAVINIAILFVAVMLVLGAVVYKTLRSEPGPGGGSTPTVVPPSGEVVEGRIALPAGARIVSQSLSGTLLSLRIAHADGSAAFLVFDTAANRIVGRFQVTGGGQ